MAKGRKKRARRHGKAAVPTTDRSPTASSPHEASASEPEPTAASRPGLYLALFAAVAVAAAALWLWRGTPLSVGAEPFNVVVVTADTLRADRLAVYGGSVPTPHLDALGDAGVVFERAISASPLTLPSHATLFTGTYPLFHGVRDNGGYRLADEQVTLAETLKAKGYQTGAFIGAFVLNESFGLGQGFDHYADELDREGAASLNASYRRGGEVVAEALGWLGARDPERPFFTWIHLYDTHRPYDPPEPFRSRHRDGAWGAYDGEAAYLDSLVGEIRSWLDDEALGERTIIAFVADHGESLGEHDELTHGFFLYDSTMHVPWILSTPYDALRGRRVPSMVRTVDLMPTLLELTAIAVPESVQGVSLVPLMSGETDDLELTALGESLLPEHYGWSPLSSFRRGGLHYIEAPRPELYDLRTDPDETRNLAGERAGTVRELQDGLDALRERAGASGADDLPAAAVDSETRARLAALGYIGERSVSRDGPRADPKDKIHLFKRIREAASELDSGRPGEAAATLDEVIARDPDIPEAYNLLGRARKDAGAFDEAIVAFQRALDLDPEYRPAVFNLALAYKDAGRLDDAAQGFARAASLDPEGGEAWLQLAEVSLLAGAPRDAAEALSRIDAKDDGVRAVVHQMEARVLLAEQRPAEAVESLKTAIELDPGLAESHYHLGVALEAMGDPAGAAEAYERELSTSGDDYQAHFSLAKLAGAAGDTESLIAHLERAIAAEPGFAVGHLYLANAYLDQGEPSRALPLAQRGLELGPDPELAPFGHFILADVYRLLGRPRDASRELAKAQALQGGAVPQ